MAGPSNVQLYSSSYEIEPLPVNTTYNNEITIALNESTSILITSNNNFSAFGFPGSGTTNDPYLIQDLNITNEGSNLIKISNTTVHFVIKNNYLSGGDVGIEFNNVNNGKIYNNSIVMNEQHGIIIEESDQNIIRKNILLNNRNGITLRVNASNNDVLSNNITDSVGYGITLSASPNNRIDHNILLNNKLHILANSVNDAKQTSIENNTINNQPLMYYQDVTNMTVSIDQGSLLVINSSDIHITNSNFTDGHTAMEFIFTRDILITNNTVKRNQEGIIIRDSNLFQISTNVVTNNAGFGIKTIASDDNVIAYNIFSNNFDDGILLQGSSHNIVQNNYLTNNTNAGIALGFSSDDNSIGMNEVTDNNDRGIYVFRSDGNSIFNNTLTNNSHFGIDISGSRSNIIIANSIVNTNGDGIELRWSQNNTLTANTVMNNNNGIWNIYSSDNFYEQNNITNNNNHGIFIDISSNENNISQNLLMDNILYGIYITITSNDNTIDFNSFIDNNPTSDSSQAFDEGRDNIFEYNYWNDWTTPDDDDDGIVDEAYPIDGGENNDNFPVADPNFDYSIPSDNPTQDEGARSNNINSQLFSINFLSFSFVVSLVIISVLIPRKHKSI